MPKFSIIVPVYNTEQYLKKCLDSIFEQTNQDFEVICVNDGSTDNSLSLLEEYKDRAIIISHENIGLSETRNKAVKIATGKYILFIDSDDYIEKELLQKIDSVTKNNPDLVRFGIKRHEDGIINEVPAPVFNNLSGKDAFKEIVKNPYVDSPCIYAYRKEFYNKNDFSFIPHVYHEDFGLIPKVIVKADKVTSISFTGYNYIKRSGSVTTDEKLLDKKVNDMLVQGKLLLASDVDSKEFYSFVANSLITYVKNIKDKNKRKKYIKNIKKLKVSNYLLKDTFGRKLKYLLCKMNLGLYIKVMK